MTQGLRLLLFHICTENNMKIECKLKREGGSKIDLDNIEYHFAPGADGAHVAEVENDEHIARFLAIPEGYRIYKAALVAEQSDATDDGDAERTDLAAQYEAKFGKKPHYRMTVESLQAALDAE
jgi:hypothetical protein